MQKLELMAHTIDVNARCLADSTAEYLQKRREAGQGTIEYIGIAVLISVLVAALVAVFNSDIKEAISKGMKDTIGKIFGHAA